jgi:hypothetical protein
MPARVSLQLPRKGEALGLPVRTVGNRIYADFLMPSRLSTFRRMLERFLDAGYTVISVETFWDIVTSGRLDPRGRHVVLRHDVDTDPGTARAMWEIERALGVQASFFFRLSTIDVPLMRAIAVAGSSASYHYEELATVAKRRRLRTDGEVNNHLVEAQAEFLGNVTHLRAATGLPMKVVASHGDFVNRRLAIPNWVILADRGFRDRAGVDLETYDEAVMEHVTSRHSDTLYPRHWLPDSPLAAVRRAEPVIYLLVHPRHWHVARVVNARDDLVRLGESIRYMLPKRHRER